MKSFEKYKRLIKLGFSLVMILMLVTKYGYLWINYYNVVILYPFLKKETG